MDLSKIGFINIIKIVTVSILCSTLIACGKKDTSSDTQALDLDLPKMSCVDVDAEIHCQGIDSNDPNGVPSGCFYYAQGNRLFLDGTLTTATAYDCGIRNRGLRCFYFMHEPNSDALIEDVICQ